MSQRFSSLEEVIKANNLDTSGLSPENVRHYAHLAMTTNSLAYVLADAAETFLMDCENALGKFDRHLLKEVKQNFRHMNRQVHSARLAAKKAAEPMYVTDSGFTDDACIDSDWWYNFLKLVDDRVGTNKQKTHLLLEFLLNMPSEGEGLFNPKFEDFVSE
jgi:hypothetical protein